MRGRMPSVFGVALSVALVAMLAMPKAVHADPHATFYTAIGQRQLFFNVLAALDQADYVEPATGELSRNALEEKRNEALRAEAKPGQEITIPKDPVSAATKTDLSGVVVRPITVEGYDLYTQQEAKDRAVEAKRQAGLADLLTRDFCRALGRTNCSDGFSALAQRSQAYVPKPLKWAAAPYIDGFIAMLASGTEDHTNRQQQIRDSKEFEPGYLFSTAIARLRKDASPETKEAINEATLRAALSAVPLAPHPDTFKDLKLDANGNVSLAFEPPQRGLTNTALAAESSDAYIARYRDKARQQLYFTQALQETANQGAATIKTAQDIIESDGEIADVKLQSRAEPKCNKAKDGHGTGCTEPPEDLSQEDRTLLPVIEVPVAAKLAEVDASAQGLADANTGLSDASVEALKTPEGAVPLIEGEGKNKVAGISTGTVAGDIDYSDTKFEPVVRAVNERFPHAGRELGHVVEAFNPGRYSDTRCGCGVDNVANAFGKQIIAAINRL